MKRVYLSVLLTISCILTMTADRLYINEFNINPGETQSVEIQLENDIAYCALQTDIVLSNGLSIDKENGEFVIDLTTRKGRDHAISYNQLPDGTIRVFVTSQNSRPFSGNSGAILTLRLAASANFTSGTVQLINNVAIEENGVRHELENTRTIASTGIFDFSVNGVYYVIDGNAVTVVGCSSTFMGGLNIPESVTNGNTTYAVTAIADNAFEGNYNLTSVTIPTQVQTIGTAAFKDCNQLKTVYYNAKSCEDYSYNADINDWSPFTNSPIKNLYIGNQVTRIPACLANHFEQITSLVIPPSVQSIGVRAFNNCLALKTVELPASITDIGDRAFAYGLSLETVTSLIEHPQELTMGSSVFYKKQANCKLMVPAASLDEYKNANQWKSFQYIEPITYQLVTSLTLEAEQLAMNVGDKKQLVYTVLPENANLKTLNWTSSNPAVAKVDSNGNIEALSQGTTTITATTTDGSGLSASCWVAVFGTGGGKLGDLNGDGIVDVSDIAKLIDIVLGKEN